MRYIKSPFLENNRVLHTIRNFQNADIRHKTENAIAPIVFMYKAAWGCKSMAAPPAKKSICKIKRLYMIPFEGKSPLLILPALETLDQAMVAMYAHEPS